MLAAAHVPARVRAPRAPRGRTWTSPGPSYNEAGPFGYTPKGGTGFGVRTLVRLAETFTR